MDKVKLTCSTVYTYFPTHLTTASPEDVANTPCPAQIMKLFPLPPLILTWIIISLIKIVKTLVITYNIPYIDILSK